MVRASGAWRRRAAGEVRGYLMAVAINLAVVSILAEGRLPRGPVATWIVHRRADAFADTEVVDRRVVLTVPLTLAGETGATGRSFERN